MVKWDALRKAKRDIKVYKYWLANQDLSQKEIGIHFNMCRTNVTRILKNVKLLIEQGKVNI